MGFSSERGINTTRFHSFLTPKKRSLSRQTLTLPYAARGAAQAHPKLPTIFYIMEHTSKALDAPPQNSADDSVQQKPQTLTSTQDLDNSTWITTKQASDQFECAQSTLKRWIKDEELKSHQVKKRSAHLVDPEHVERMLRLRSHVTSIFHPAKPDDVTPPTTGDTDVTPSDSDLNDVTSHPTTKDVTSPENQSTEDDKVYLTKPFPPQETTQSKPAASKRVETKSSGKHQAPQREGVKPPRDSHQKRNRRPKRKPKTDLNHVVKMAMSLPVSQRLSLRNQLTSNLDSVI